MSGRLMSICGIVVLSLSGPTSTRVKWFEKSRYPLYEIPPLSRIANSADYFLADFFAAQYAFNLADNFALAAGLIAFFFALTAGRAEGVADLVRRRLAHHALC